MHEQHAKAPPLGPAAIIISAFGGGSLTQGFKIVAQITGRDITRVRQWVRPVAKRGTGGRIPQAVIPDLLLEGQQRGIGVTADMFLPAAKH